MQGALPGPCSDLLPRGLPGQGAGTELAGEQQQEMVVLLFVLAAESRSRAHGQAAAPPVGCIVLPLCFGAGNHSAWNKSHSNSEEEWLPETNLTWEAAGKHF